MYNPNDDDDSLFEDYRAAEIIKHSGLLIISIGQVNNYIVTINIWNDSFFISEIDHYGDANWASGRLTITRNATIFSTVVQVYS